MRWKLIISFLNFLIYCGVGFSQTSGVIKTLPRHIGEYHLGSTLENPPSYNNPVRVEVAGVSMSLYAILNSSGQISQLRVYSPILTPEAAARVKVKILEQYGNLTNDVSNPREEIYSKEHARERLFYYLSFQKAKVGESIYFSITDVYLDDY